ncbi:MAG TPA: biotin carboxylase N-terminal domain-containing protein, partial [Egibacteraceae bacterium]|nr:biotin carboxylase N-terminal domain-containing protein [Egibacteraceae bacterium]
MFAAVLVANRGEVAVRIIRTLDRMGIRSVAVHSDSDADALHVRLAADAVRIGPASAAESYLRADRIIEAAADAGAEAIHPGYGFLSESAGFASACAAAGLVFVGPPAAAIAAMGDKIQAKRTAERAGVAVVPGTQADQMSDDELIAAAFGVGFPLLIKPAAGGGGKGMRAVSGAAELAEAIAGARREARAAFADDRLLLEALIPRPRHLEIQILADTRGAAVHLGERECSLQRRHQKIIEECPSPLADAALRERMGTAALDVARACDYVSAGTVEFIVPNDAPESFYFMEMNTRLQVEHPVTEIVTGVDLVQAQLDVAEGRGLPWAQADLTQR